MYQTSIVTFLDILGFSELLLEADPSIINKKLDAVESFTAPFFIEEDELEKELNPRVFQFSDSIIRVRSIESKLNTEYPDGILFHEFLNLVHAQSELIQHGVLLRGGIAIGAAFISETRVFGPAMVSAYKLESKFALYPRIVIEPAIFKEFKSNNLLKASWHTTEQESEYLERLIRKGDDGIWFIDYARAVERELDDPSMYSGFLGMHRELIVKNARKFNTLSNEMSKYLWLSNYHNEIVGELDDNWFEHYDVERESLSISSDDIEHFQRL